MYTNSLDLDFAYDEDDETLDDAITTFIAPYRGRIVASVVIQHGPGGGWPIVRFDATSRVDLMSLALTYCAGDVEQANELLA